MDEKFFQYPRFSCLANSSHLIGVFLQTNVKVGFFCVNHKRKSFFKVKSCYFSNFNMFMIRIENILFELIDMLIALE